MKRDEFSFLVSGEELKLLKNVLYLEPGLIDGIDNAKREGNFYIVRFDPVEVEEALEALAYSAGCVESYIEQEKYIRLCEKISQSFSDSRSLRRSIDESQIRRQLDG